MAKEQARIFLTMLACGAALGLLYDLGRGLFFLAKGGRAAEALLDLGFWGACALTVTGAALLMRTSPFRLYVMLGAAAGTGLYEASAGRAFRAVCTNILKRSGEDDENRKKF